MTIATPDPVESMPPPPPPPLEPAATPPTVRLTSVDALRGFVMFVMIYVNDLNGDVAPWWMKHYSDTGFGPNGMTFVDLVFPAFIFIVGLSIPLAVTARRRRGEPVAGRVGHVLLRTASLLAVGILMVNAEERGSATMVIPGPVWDGLMFLCAILAFCSIAPRHRRGRGHRIATWTLRSIGIGGLLWLTLIYRGGDDQAHILSKWTLPVGRGIPWFTIHHSWYGILGLIGWAYLVASAVFGIFGTRRLPILSCVALLFCLYFLDKNGAFDDVPWLGFVSVGEDLGTHAAIAVAGVLLGTALLTADTAAPATRVRFALWFTVGFAAAALLVHPPLEMYRAHPPLWGISKNAATPAWGLWASAATAAAWVCWYLVADVWGQRWLARPWAIAGQNVLLAYLLSEGLESWLGWAHLGAWYDGLAEQNLAHAMGRSIGCAAVILVVTAVLNRVGFWVKL